jgi:hypothetical protein
MRALWAQALLVGSANEARPVLRRHLIPALRLSSFGLPFKFTYETNIPMQRLELNSLVNRTDGLGWQC